MDRYKVVDLFCGAGGLSKGFLDAGYDVVLGVDYDDSALATFKANHGSADAMKLDLYNHENIRMYTDDNHLTNDNNWNLIHHAFGKCRDGKYRYIGTYVKRKTPNYPHDAIFERIDTTIDLTTWNSSIDLPEEKSKQERILKTLSTDKLFRLAVQQESDVPEVVEQSTRSAKRSLAVSMFAKVRANGFCELCEKEAPFKKKNGEPYLETHHIIPLGEGGADTIENTVALCPNCHRKMHQLMNPKDVAKLQNIPKCQIR